MDKFYDRYLSYKTQIDAKLFSFIEKNNPAGLYDPMKYVLSSGGKRIRPMITILSCEAFGGNFESTLDAAVAMEILHNFTLVHDDIMDNADTRRAEPTVHKKWDISTAILAGDGLLGLSYRSLLRTSSPNIGEITKSFTEGMIDVCEGQSYDKEFELKSDVSIDEYIMMIGMKTSRLLETCAEIGVLIAGGNTFGVETMKKFAGNTGLAFQIQDDLLDITADEKEFGKKIGGDILEGKKTYLLLRAMEKASDPEDKQLLKRVVSKNGYEPVTENDIPAVKKIYSDLGVIDETRSKVGYYTQKAGEYLEKIPDSDAKEMLEWFSVMLIGRSS